MTVLVQSPDAARAAAGVTPLLTGLPITAWEQAKVFCQFLAVASGWKPRGATFPMLEVRTKAERGMRQSFHVDPTEAAVRALVDGEHTDAYVGVLARTRPDGGAASVVPQARVIWVECDTEESVVRLLEHPIQPTMIVRSSRGKAHAYWSLRTPLDTELIVRANKRLAYHLGADMRATDKARILRVPGTWNHKYDPPQRVLTHELETRLTSARELVAHLEDPVEQVKVIRPVRPRLDDPTKDRIAQIPTSEYAPHLAGRGLVGKFMQCPFHGGGQERTPSFHVGGPADTLYKCFGCDEGGDIFTLAGALWGLDTTRNFREILDRLEREFR